MKSNAEAGRRLCQRLAASALLAVALPASAADACPAGAGVQLLRQQLLPGSPAYYRACGMPAASARARQLAVGDGEDAVGPSACATHLCIFDAGTGRRLSRTSLTEAPAGVELGEHLRPLMNALHGGVFQPMQAMPSQRRPRGATLDDGRTRIEFDADAGGAGVVVRRAGHVVGRHPFKAKTLRCESQPPRRALPQELNAWSTDGVAAVVLAAQYLGTEPGCSWTEWVVVPLKGAARR